MFYQCGMFCSLFLPLERKSARGILPWALFHIALQRTLFLAGLVCFRLFDFTGLANAARALPGLLGILRVHAAHGV